MSNELKMVLFLILGGFGTVILYDILDYLDHRATWVGLLVVSIMLTVFAFMVHPIFWSVMLIVDVYLIFMCGFGFDLWYKPKKKREFVKLDTPEMYGRRNYDQEMTDILKEAEKMREDLPLVTLWWGLQGLRLNKDGTTKWISRHPVDIPKDDPVTATPSFGYAIGPQIIPTYPLACTSLYQPILYGFDCQIATPEDRISLLEAQERELTLAMAQSYQTRAILDNLKQWEVVNEEKGSYVKVTDISGNSYLEPCAWTHSQEKHTL